MAPRFSKTKKWLLWVCMLLLLFAPGMVKLAATRWRSDHLQQQIVSLQESNQQLREAIERLESDPVYIEQVARERFGLAREGETILYFDEQDKP